MMKFVIKFFSNRWHRLKHRWVRKLAPIFCPNSVVNYPFKCRRYPQLTQQYLTERSVVFDHKVDKKLDINSFRELFVDNESETLVKEIIRYYNSYLIKSRFCPSIITVKDMEYMLKNSNRWQRHLEFLFVREFDSWRRDKENEELKALKREKERKELESWTQIGCFDEQNNIQYGYWRNSLFTRSFNRGLKKYSNHRLRTATLFGQPLVIDCSFDKEMQDYEVESVGRQMARIYQINKLQTQQPFDIHYCGCNPDSRVIEKFKKYLQPMEDLDRHYVNIHCETYSQLFPNERFIYLSPDARDLMTEFDPKAIYILGSLVGKTCRLPLTKWKAEEEGIQCFKLPIHKFVALNPGVKKALSFSSVFRILSEVRAHSDWELAFINSIQDHKLKQKL